MNVHLPVILPARSARRPPPGRTIRDAGYCAGDVADAKALGAMLPLFVAIPLYVTAVICLGWEMFGDPPFNGDRLGWLALTIVLGDTLVRTFREEMRRRR
jgi:hypothetical protein